MFLSDGLRADMKRVVNATELRTSLTRLLRRVRAGERITVLYRSRPAFEMVPVEGDAAPGSAVESDSLFHAKAVGRSTDGLSAADHDGILCGR